MIRPLLIRAVYQQLRAQGADRLTVALAFTMLRTTAEEERVAIGFSVDDLTVCWDCEIPKREDNEHEFGVCSVCRISEENL